MKIWFDNIQYNDLFVLESGSLAFDYGKTTVISGESGSGKTSLFYSIINNSEISSYETLSYLSQSYIFLEDLTIQQHINLIQTMTTQTLEDIDYYIRRLNINKCLDMYPSQLSGGERNRVAFLLCLYKDTDLLILDEPTASLNEEYSYIYIDILNRLKQKNKAIIIFTHDQVLINYADIHYHIDNHHLNSISEEYNHDNHIEYKHIKKNINKLPNILFKSKKHYKISKKIILVALTIMMALSAVCFSLSHFIYQSQQDLLSRITSNEIVVFKASPHVTGASLKYTFGSEIPLTEEDIDTIQNINHVDSYEWRVDLDFMDIVDSFDITVKPYSVNEELSVAFDLYRDGKSFAQINSPYSSTLSTYVYEKRSHSDIQLDFNNKGIYLSRKLADIFKEKLNVLDEELKDIEIEMTIPVPVYNTFGRFMGSSGDDSLQYIYNTTVVDETVRIPIGGILYESSLGLSNDSELAIYIERDIYSELIDKHRTSRNRKLYVIDSDYQNYFVDDVPGNYKGEFNRVFEDNVWTYTAVSVYADGIENIPDIVSDLEEKGYSVNNQVLEFNAINKGIQSLQEMMFYVSIFVGVIVLLFSIGVLYNERHRNKNMTLYLKQLGLNNKEILNIKESYYFKDMIYEFIRTIISAIIIYVGLCLYLGVYFDPSVISLIAIIILVTTTHFIIPFILEKRMLNDKNKKIKN